MLKKIYRNIINPRGLAIKLVARLSPFIKSDRLYLSLRYRLFMGRPLNLKNPQSFNEKLNWMKIYYHVPIFTKLVDKFEAKKIVANLIGEEYIIPTLGVWNNVDDIDFEKLPESFVLKCTHDSGGLIVCKNKSKLDISETKKKLSKALKNNYYLISREWGYKNVPARIIAEQYMEDSKTHALNDYKFFCFNGDVRLLFVATDRSSEVKFDFFDSEFKHLDIHNAHPWSRDKIEKPSTFEKMKEVAAKLSAGYPFMRIDLYEVDGKVYFGEYTLYHYGGTIPFEPESIDYHMGSWITLPNKTV